MKICYSGYSKDLMSPGDRRRLAAFRDKLGVEFVDYSLKPSVVYITMASNLTYWLEEKKKKNLFDI